MAALVVLVTAVGGAARGNTESELQEVQDKIDALSSQIEAAQTERSEAASAVLAAKNNLADLVGQVQAAEGVLASIEVEIAAENVELERVTGLLDRFASALATTQLKMSDTKEALSVQVVELYMNASMDGARLFGFDDAAEATIGFAYVDGLRGDSSTLLDQLDILRAEETRQKGILSEQRGLQQELLADLDLKQAAQVEEVARVEDLKAQASEAAAQAEALVVSINGDIASFEQHKEGLEADAAALEAELAARPTTGTAPTSGLMRPVPGPVSSGFGYRIHPIFGTKKLHTGWDMSASSGDPIVASADGVVVSAGVRGGYGNAVVIDHGGGLATLYAHQSSMAVSGGQQVEQGQIIGYVGCTGYCTGPHLHFETRVGGRPVDPSGYMG
ncbi:MAG: peptidoglycan DD-metalloendopeptidase family protein [Acidimicrobiia bacterium]